MRTRIVFPGGENLMQEREISIVVPCYNEAPALPHLYTELTALKQKLPGVSFEFVLVDDGSTDGTRDVIRDLSQNDADVRYVFFPNFGKEAALLAGLKPPGKYVAVMDADLQDPPSLLPEMYSVVKSGDYDCAATRRVSRKGEPLIRSFFARSFYRLMSKISDAHIVDGARDYRLMSRRMVDAILSLKEYNRFSKGIFSWVGFETRWFEYQNIERVAGETKWSFWKLFLYSLEGITAFSTAPLIFASVMGMLFCLIAFITICVVVVKTLLWGDPVAGYPSLLSIILFIGGVQLFAVGILGQYLAKTYLETKKRPVYIIKEQSK